MSIGLSQTMSFAELNPKDAIDFQAGRELIRELALRLCKRRKDVDYLTNWLTSRWVRGSRLAEYLLDQSDMLKGQELASC